MKELSTDALIEGILCADASAQRMPSLLDALRERFSELFPDQELLTLTAPGSCPDDQIESLRKAAGLLSSLIKK